MADRITSVGVPQSKIDLLLQHKDKIKAGDLNLQDFGMEITTDGRLQPSEIPAPPLVPITPGPAPSVVGLIQRTYEEHLSGDLGISDPTMAQVPGFEPGDDGTVMGAVRTFNRSIARTGSVAGDVVLRGMTAIGMIPATAGAIFGEKMGWMTPAEARQFFRDMNGIVLSAGVVSGAGPVNRPQLKKVSPGQAENLRRKMLQQTPLTKEQQNAINEVMEQADEYVRSTQPKQEVLPPERLPPAMRQRMGPEVFNRIIKVFEDAKVDYDFSVTVTENIVRLMEQDPIKFGAIDSAMQAQGFTFAHMMDIMAADVSASARQLAALSKVKRQAMVRLAAEMTGEGADATAFMNALRRQGDPQFSFYDMLRNADNIRRGMMVTLPQTAARNAIVAAGRVGLDVMQDAMDISIQHLMGMEGAPLATPIKSFAGTLRALLSPTKGPLRQELVDEVLKAFPTDRERLFLRYSSDVKGGSQVVDTLNVFNRMQEFIFRRAKFAAELDKTLRQKGSSLEQAVRGGAEHIKLIDEAAIGGAIDKALEFTFAADPKHNMAKGFVKAVNAMPFIGTGVIPYPRFLTNATSFMFEHSPLGPLQLLGPKARNALIKGDTSVISKSLAGVASFHIAGEIYDKYHKEGNKWYELTFSDETGEEITYDARAYNPFATLLFMHDVVDKHQRNVVMPDTREYLESFFGVRGGGPTVTSVEAIDGIINGLFDIHRGDIKRNIRRGTGAVSDILGQYLTPLAVVSDAVGSFDEFMAQQHTMSGEEFGEPASEEFVGRDIQGGAGAINLSPLVNRFPIAKQALPERPSPTREKASPKLSPLKRQVTGLTEVAKKNPVELEVDRLGIQIFKLMPKTGFPNLDRRARATMGSIVENVLVPQMQTKQWLALPDQAKIIGLKKSLAHIYSSARDTALIELVREGGDPNLLRNYAAKFKLTTDQRRLLGVPLVQ